MAGSRMRWPWSKRKETRSSSSSFADFLISGVQSQAEGQAFAGAQGTSAVEVAASLWSSVLSGAEVIGDDRVQQAITPRYLALVGRHLITRGEVLHKISISDDGKISLIPCASWHWEGSHDPSTWTVRATAYGPSSSTTWFLPDAGVVFIAWGTTPGQPYVGTAPWRNANVSAGLLANLEKRLAQEADTPLGNLLTVPEDPGDEDDNEFAALKSAIGNAAGQAFLMETTADNFGRGPSGSPQRDWDARRLGANPPQSMIDLRKDAERSVLAACGISDALAFDATGTGQREALRRFINVHVEPRADMLARELSAKLETPISFSFRSAWAHDLQGRTTSMKNLTSAGVDIERALKLSGMADV